MDELLKQFPQAELLELTAINEAPAQGVVVESRLDRGRGPVATVLIQNGQLKQGDIVIRYLWSGSCNVERYRREHKEAGPSQPVSCSV